MRFLVFVLFIVGLIYLQIRLSKMKNKWFGLIIPTIFFIFSLLGVLNMAVYTSFTKETINTLDESGVVIAKQVIENSSTNVPSLIFTTVIILLLYNIPTAIFLGIYAVCRDKIKKNSELEKMNIQDLE
ncbi:hypothetical protein [Clostridium intestinale]|uniref:Uncharacterized protein n=1 Tax=Clostridium intestinale DSM 6191 TaxID=1121320 RepID=A0A1M5UHC3_9CLOT|nr:hypothetical protein [Clostridium intestinale]SHH62330.1 hypothetical protein SAMN02745941_00526 [Clostridium intestinale DSM 6191]